MSRMITMSKAASLATLVAAVMAGTSAHGQVIDLRLPPFGGGTRPGQHGAPHHPGSGQFVPGRPGARPIRPVDHGFAPGVSDPHGYPAPGFPGGFPGGAVPPAPAIAPPFPGTGGGGGHCSPGVSPAIGAVDQLIAQVGAFLQAFGPTVRCVPQGEQIYGDAVALYESALAFRQAALAGAPPCDLQRIYAAMDHSCGRLVSRVNCIARGRTGPNIEQVRLIGALCGQLRALI